MTEAAYDPKIAGVICRRIGGGESLRAICREKGFPGESTVRGWAMRNQQGFHECYRQARVQQMETMADEIVEIADCKDIGARERWVMIDTRRWFMARLAPRRYGDRLRQLGDAKSPTHAGAVSLKMLSVEELDTLAQFAETRLAGKAAASLKEPVSYNGTARPSQRLLASEPR